MIEFSRCHLLLFSISVIIAGEPTFSNVHLIFQDELAERMLPHFISAAKDYSLKYQTMIHGPSTRTFRIAVCTAQTASPTVLHKCYLQQSEATNKLFASLCFNIF